LRALHLDIFEQPAQNRVFQQAAKSLLIAPESSFQAIQEIVADCLMVHSYIVFCRKIKPRDFELFLSAA